MDIIKGRFRISDGNKEGTSLTIRVGGVVIVIADDKFSEGITIYVYRRQEYNSNDSLKHIGKLFISDKLIYRED